jgi:hypothetical protein
LIHCGGYNCRHTLNWVTKFLALELTKKKGLNKYNDLSEIELPKIDKKTVLKKSVKTKKAITSKKPEITEKERLKDEIQKMKEDKNLTSDKNKNNVKYQKSLAIYQGNAFDAINNELRYDKPDKYKGVISDLDKITLDKTSKDLYRGLSSDFTKQIFNDFKIKDRKDIVELREKLIGKSFKDKSFVSTSFDKKVALDFAKGDKTTGGTLMKIGGEKTGANVQDYLKNRKSESEKEFLIKRNTEFIITDVSFDRKGNLKLSTKIKKKS